MKKIVFTLGVFLFIMASALAQTGNISGKVISARTGDRVPFASVQLDGQPANTFADQNGHFSLSKVPIGEHTLQISSVGFKQFATQISLKTDETLQFVAELQEEKLNLNEVVVTGTRTAKRITDSPVIVNLINSKELDQVVATNLSEGLRFQPGLRIETDCQTCNYTQLRINGLQGGYSQILINGRPIFSPLTGLYGMEQIPINMIERIEVVRGGISALYGSSAIGGTVNVITKIPTSNNYDITNTFQSIDGKTTDNILSGNATIINKAENAGATFFMSNRNRAAYDANGDNFSELPQLKNNSFGANMFFLPTENQKLELSLSSIYEYRYGGEMVDKPAFLTQQSEERSHHVFMGSADYQLNFNDNKNALIIYYGGQSTIRKHYTGILPDDSLEFINFTANPPYGTSEVNTHQGGVQLNSRFDNFLGGDAVLTVGGEYVYDDVFDQIEAYNYLIDQTTTNLGIFAQHDWNITPQLNFLAGLRLDNHNLVDQPVLSPRLSVLYKLRQSTQFRVGWGTGFRAPQAFDTDLHIAFAGGGVSRISLADDLKEERSNSFTASVNYDKATQHYILGFTLEGFYTTLKDAFYQFPLGTDEFGERFEKRNGSGATVQGVTLELRANFDYLIQLDAGFTIQSSRFDDPIEHIEGLPTKREFLRTPNDYGYATLTYNPTKRWSISSNLVYTGTMELAHFGGENTGQDIDEFKTSEAFTELSLRAGHTFELKNISTGIEIFGGIKNIFNAYQSDFDIGKNRDSNYVYGPGIPRTYFLGLRIKSL